MSVEQQLRDRIEELERLLGLTDTFPLALGISGRQAEMLGLLLRRESVSKETAMVAIYSDSESPPDDSIISVFLVPLRKRFPGAIRNKHGVGWWISGEDKRAIRETIEQARQGMKEAA